MQFLPHAAKFAIRKHISIWLIALVALLWGLPTAAQAAAGAGSGPRAHWTDMQKLEFYLGQLGGMLNICGYYSLSSDLKELANLSPYGREGIASVMAYDAIRGGYCGKLAADGETLMADRDQLWAYLTRIYDCPGGTCLPEGGDNTETAACRAEAEAYLGGLPLKEDDIKSITMREANAISKVEF